MDQNIIRFPLRFAVKRNFFFVSVLLLSNRADPSRHRCVVYGQYPISGKTGLEVVSSLQHCPLVFCIEVNLSDRYGTLKSSSAATWFGVKISAPTAVLTLSVANCACRLIFLCFN